MNSNFLINFLEKVKSNKKLCSNYEIAIIKMEKIISLSYKTKRNFKISDYVGRANTDMFGYYERRCMDTQVYKFKHPRSATCARTDSECGFILKGSAFSGTLELCTEEKYYSQSGVHLHSIISAREMFWYNTYTSTYKGNEITVAGSREWWESWFPYAENNNFDGFHVAYDLAGYLIAKED